MQFKAQEDITAPIDAVFSMVSDVDRFERMAMRRGVEVRRVVSKTPLQAGAEWHTRFSFRGKPRDISVVMTECERPSLMQFTSSSRGMIGQTVIELLALSPRHTRLSIQLSLAAKTLPARLLLQSMKLGQARFRRQFQARLSDFAQELEQRHNHGV